MGQWRKFVFSIWGKTARILLLMCRDECVAFRHVTHNNHMRYAAHALQMHLLSCGRSRAWLLGCSCGEPLMRVEADDRRNWVVRPLPVAAAPRAPAAAPAPVVLDRHRLDHRTWCARVFATAWVRCVMPSSWNSQREVSRPVYAIKRNIPIGQRNINMFEENGQYISSIMRERERIVKFTQIVTGNASSVYCACVRCPSYPFNGVNLRRR